MRAIPPLLWLIMLTMAPGCEGPNKRPWLSLNPNDWANRGLIDEPVMLDVAGPVEIDVESFSGDVYILGDPSLTQARVTIAREALHGHGRVDEARHSLGDIQSTATLVPGELGQSLQVRTQTSNGEPHYQRAHVYIEAPEIDGVKVRTANGRVKIKNIRGRVDITTSEAKVYLATNQPMNRPVTIVNRNGEIEFRVRAESQGAIDAQTINGRAHGFARYGKLVIGPESRNDIFKATLNEGRNLITLRTVNADIYVAVVHNPELAEVRLPG
jgi:hypothetical protein